MSTTDSARRTLRAAASPNEEARPHRATSRKSHKIQDRPLWLLIPGAVLIALVIIVPLILAVYMSLLGLDQYSLREWLTAPFVGVQNYIVAATQSQLFQSMWVSVSYSVLSTAITLPIGIMAALATQNTFRGRALVRSLFLIPYILPAFVVATVWRTIFQPGGVWVKALGALGIHEQLWLNGPNSYWTLVIVQVWSAWPFIYLMTLAALQSIEREVYEAASIDGTSWRQKLRLIVFPYLRAPLALACILAILLHLNNFTLPYVLFGVPAPTDAETLTFLSYVTSFQTYQFGLGAAIALASLALLAVPLIVYLRAVRLDVGETEKQK